MVFDGDDGVAQVGGDAGERHVAPMLFEREPRLSVGAVEHRLADAARKLVDREPVANDDAAGDERRRRVATIDDREDREVFQRARVAKRMEHFYIVRLEDRRFRICSRFNCRRRGDVVREVVHADQRALGEDDGALDDVLQLADVAGPCEVDERAQRVRDGTT